MNVVSHVAHNGDISKSQKNFFLKISPISYIHCGQGKAKKNGLHAQIAFTFFIQWNNEAKPSQI